MKLKVVLSVAVAAVVLSYSLPAAAAPCGAGCSYTENTANFLSDPGQAFNPTPVASSLFHQTLFNSVTNVYRSPYENSNDTKGPGYGTNSYSSVQGGGYATFDFAKSNTLSLLWGSPDGYNTLKFYSGKGGTGDLLYTIIGNLSLQTYGHDLVTVSTALFFQSVVLLSSTNAFEFAALQASCTNCPAPAIDPVPLPAALPLFATVLAGGGIVAWRRKRKAANVATK